MSNQYSVTFQITGKDYNTGEENSKLVVDAKVEFYHHPNDYGNGYGMLIKSSVEPFGYQGYDIRYDTEFRESEMLSYIVRFFSNRYNGKNGAWKLIGITVLETEFEELVRG